MCGNPNAIYLFPVLLGLFFLGVFIYSIGSGRVYVGEPDERWLSYRESPRAFVLFAASCLWLALLLIVFIPLRIRADLESLAAVVLIGLPLSALFTGALMKVKLLLLRRLEDQSLLQLGATSELIRAVREENSLMIERELRQLKTHPQLGALVTAIKRIEQESDE